jgi:hypothetical protein
MDFLSLSSNLPKKELKFIIDEEGKTKKDVETEVKKIVENIKTI